MTNTTRVFVVERDPSVRIGFVRLLRKAGHDAQDYPSVAEFLEALEPGISGCLILDGEMAVLAGKDLLSELRTRGLHLPIIIVSVDDDERIRSTARDLKAVGYFRKAVDGNALLDAVRWTMEQVR